MKTTAQENEFLERRRRAGQKIRTRMQKLGEQLNIEVVGQAANGRAAIHLAWRPKELWGKEHGDWRLV